MSDVSEKDGPKCPMTQFVIRIDRETAQKVKDIIKSEGRKGEPFIREMLTDVAQQGTYVPYARRNELSREACRLQELLGDVNLDSAFSRLREGSVI